MMTVDEQLKELIAFLTTLFDAPVIATHYCHETKLSLIEIQSHGQPCLCFSIQDDCFYCNSLERIKQVMAGAGHIIMLSNPDKTMQLNADLTVTI